MNTKEIVKELARKKRITIAELERKLGIANGTIGKWDKQNPTTEPLKKLSDYFDVSIDYLLGETENPYRIKSPAEDFDVYEEPEEKEVITMFRQVTEDLNEEQTKKFNSSLDSLMKAAKKIIEDDSNWK